ncbi:uncharacterized protein LOC126832996 isoform X2 [Adelges cooleyi]|uniref:uncharacterized protein LOC126832996 isoform X2 n=1 Tax=Adelges cooleyi TaxID=133065 RepID=UPI00217F320A|nr:uncharacterized protein LOC126832996 isoform X2 [Adelges cooleyi]
MFYKIVVLLTCTSMVSCVKKIDLDEHDQAISNAFNKTIESFNRIDHITIRQFLRIIGNDQINRDILKTHFRKNPHIHKKNRNIINEGLFFDLVYAVGRDRGVSTKELALKIIKQIEKTDDFAETLKCEETLDEEVLDEAEPSSNHHQLDSCGRICLVGLKYSEGINEYIFFDLVYVVAHCREVSIDSLASIMNQKMQTVD